MKFFTSEYLNHNIIRIRDLSTTACYLILGKDKNCLIDTCLGCGSLKDYINNKLGHSIDMVILTHGHHDHCGGISEFVDLPIYMNYRDIELGNIGNSAAGRAPRFKSYGIDEKFLLPNIDFSITKNIKEGDIFCLGGITLEIIEAPGSTHGMCMVLIKELRTILFSDACGTRTLMCMPISTSIEEYRESLVHIKKKYEKKYDYVLKNHGSCECKKELLDEVIECCELILSGEDDKGNTYGAASFVKDEETYFAKTVNANTHSRLDGKSGNIIYIQSKIFKSGGNK